MSGAEYLMHILDGAFCENDIKPNVRDFAVNYYDKQYFNDYGKTCPAKDLCVPCYGFISGDDDYNALKPRIDKAYEKYFVDQLPYTDEELVDMSKLSMEDLKATAAKLSIEDAASRAGN